MIKIVLDFKNLSLSGKIAFGSNVLAKTKGNLLFATTKPTRAEVETVQNEFDATITAAKDGTKAQIALRNAKETEWDTLMEQYAMSITDICKGDVEKLLTSGFTLSKKPTPAPVPQAPDKIKVMNQNHSSAISLQWPAVAGARTYVVSCIGPDGTVVADLVVLRGKALVEGLTPGVVYTFKTRAIGTAGSSPWSAPISCMCL